jgi:hypothetical protein
MKFKSDIEVQAGLRDSSGALGGSGQILSSTSGNVSWVTPTVNTVARDVQNQVKAGVAINKGQAVYVTGADGTNIIVGLASNVSEATSSKTLGLLNATVAINGFADVVQIGRLAGLNTLAATVGDPVWLGTGGNLIYGLINKPYAPAHLVFIGVVTRVNVNNGEIFVNVQNGFELSEIHDVDLKTTVPINGDILGFNGTLWVNKTIAGWLGYTPANASGTTNYVSKFTGAATLGNSIIYDNGGSVIIGGTTLPDSGLKTYVTNGTVGIGNYLSSTVGYIGTWTNHPFSFAVNGSEKVRILDNGNVGIGTTAPTVALQIGDTTSGTGNYIKVLGNNSDSTYDVFVGARRYPRFTLEDTTVGGSAFQMWSLGNTMRFGTNTGTAETSAWYTKAGNAADVIFNGKVGIGTTTPYSKFTTYGALSTSTSQISIVNSEGGHIILRAGIQSVSNSGLSIISANVDGTSQNTRLVINSAGNVGIGTTSPSAKVDLGDSGAFKVTQSAVTEVYVEGTGVRLKNIYTGGGWARGILVYEDSAGTDYFQLGGYGSGQLMTYAYMGPAYNTPWQVWTSTGNVGIGTTAPATLLDVNGVITATGGNSTSWNAKQDAITGAATTITTSNLTASRVLVSDASGKVAANTVTTTTLGYLDATSSIQTQLNGKQGSLTLTTTGSSGAATLVGNTLNIPQYGAMPVKLTSQTLTAASWTLVGTYYTYAFSNVNIDTTSDVSVTPQNASYLTAYNAQVLPFVGVAAGVATFYSQFPPTANMTVDIVITQTA